MRCTEHEFEIKYSVINHSIEPTSGTIQARFNERLLAPVGTDKLNELAPGKTTNGSFLACCPADGLFVARFEYREETSKAAGKVTAKSPHVTDSVNISCK
jgi:hypothetical protein